MEITTLEQVRDHGESIHWGDALWVLTGTGNARSGLTDEEGDRLSDATEAAYSALRPKLMMVYEAMLGDAFVEGSPIDEVFSALFSIGFDTGHALPPPPVSSQDGEGG